MKHENSGDEEGALPAIPIPKRRRTSEKSAPRSTAGKAKKKDAGASEDDINSLFWLVEVRAGNVAHRPISHPRPAIGFVGSRRVFFRRRTPRAFIARQIARAGARVMEIGGAARPARSSHRGHGHPRDGRAANAARHAVSRRARPVPPRSPFLAFRHHTWTLWRVRKLCRAWGGPRRASRAAPAARRTRARVTRARGTRRATLKPKSRPSAMVGREPARSAPRPP